MKVKWCTFPYGRPQAKIERVRERAPAIEPARRAVQVINEYIDDVEQTIIFAATRHHVEFLGGLLARAGYRTSIIFGDLDPAARRISVAKFRAKKSQFLVVTDIAARGIDIPMLDNVINYDFPMTSKLFVHRVGRAARAGRKGTAISFVSGDEMPYMLDVHLFLGRKPCNLPEAEVDINDPTTVVYGRFPSEMIEVQAAMVLDWVSRDPWLISQIKTMKNAYKAYFKSRSKASPQSVKRFKQLPPEAAIHPWIQQKLGSEAVLRIDMVSELKTFRPATQIFKMSSKSGTGRAGTVKVDPRVVAHRAARPTETVDRFDSDAAAAAQPGVGSTAAAPLKQGGVAPTGGKLSKRAKRKGAQHRQQALPQGQKPTATGRDEAFFIEHRPENAFVEDSLRVNNSDSGVHDNRTAIEEAVINLVNDDSALKKRSTMQWDKRKMKYIETNSTSTKGKRGIEIKNEAGVVISTKSRKTGKERPSFYQNWVEKTNTRIPKAGTMEASEALQGAERGANFVVGGKLVGKRRGKGGRLVGGDAGPGGGKGPRNAQEARNGMEKAARARGQGVKTGSTGKANGGVSELRLVAQIGKERKKKDMIKARLSKLKSKKKRRK